MKPWTKHDIKDFSEVQIVETNTALISKPDDVKPLTIEAIGAPIPHKLKALIINGRKLEGENYTSRSEATFAVMTGLARMGVSIDKIAGVCINPEYAISERFLEKHQPEVQALREANRAEIFTSQDWRDVFKDGRPRPTFRNAYIGIIRLGIICTYDEFKNRLIVGSAPVQQYIGELSDKAVTIIRKVFLDTHDYDPFSNNIRDGLETLALENTVHPLKTYFTSLKWDGIPRIRGFFTNYMGADNTELNRAVAFIMLVAAIRRVFDPGCKFDTMVVLEGKQGSGKSTALKILASEEFFSDQDILSADNKTQMELLEGVWIYEVCELSGLKHTDTAKLKSFLSRQEDRGRPAYGRYKEVNKRQSIFVGTTNDENYLKDRTGNRRFIPVKTGKIDLVAIKRDRDQIWAEAVYWEEKGEPITLPEDLWTAAAREQAARMYQDPWLDLISGISSTIVGDEERVFTKDILKELEIPSSQQQHYQTTRVRDCMRKLGWEGPKRIRINGNSLMGYFRPVDKQGDENEPGF